MASGWEFVAEITRSSDFSRAALRFVPQVILLVIIGAQLLSSVSLRVHRHTHVRTIYNSGERKADADSKVDLHYTY